MKATWTKVLGPPKSSQGKSKHDYAQRVQTEARRWCDSPFQGEVTVLLFYVLKEKHGQEPDLDNLTKVVLDALKGIAYVDDQQISHFRVQRFYCGTDFACSAPALPPDGGLQRSIMEQEECTYVGVVSPTQP